MTSTSSSIENELYISYSMQFPCHREKSLNSNINKLEQYYSTPIFYRIFAAHKQHIDFYSSIGDSTLVQLFRQRSHCHQHLRRIDDSNKYSLSTTFFKNLVLAVGLANLMQLHVVRTLICPTSSSSMKGYINICALLVTVF